MLHTSEQFASKQFKEHHEDVTQGVADKQERQAGSIEDGRLVKHDRDDPETRSQMIEVEVQNDPMHDRNSE